MMPDDTLKRIIGDCMYAVSYEIQDCSRPVSRISGPAGEQRPESLAEQHERVVITSILYAIERGYLAVTPEAPALLAEAHMMQRQSREGIAGLLQDDGTYSTA